MDVAFDGKTGHLMALGSQYDIILLDIGLPHLNGYELCTLRRRDAQVPIVMLTALGTTDNKVEALTLGADNYVVKPFEFRELLTRVRALTRRAQPDFGPVVLQAVNLELNPTTKQVACGGQLVTLTAREFALLEVQRTYVIRVANGHTELVNVQVGDENSGQVQVFDKLRAGDVVLRAGGEEIAARQVVQR